MAIRRQIWRPTITTEVAGEVLLVTLAGRLGEAGARAQPLLAALAGAEPHAAIVVDLSRLDYVSSPGVAHLAAFNRTQGQRGIPCCWSDVPEAVRVSLDLAGVLADFRIARSRADALASLAGVGPTRPPAPGP